MKATPHIYGGFVCKEKFGSELAVGDEIWLWTKFVTITTRNISDYDAIRKRKPTSFRSGMNFALLSKFYGVNYIL